MRKVASSAHKSITQVLFLEINTVFQHGAEVLYWCNSNENRLLKRHV